MNTKQLQHFAEFCTFINGLSPNEKVAIIKTLSNNLSLEDKVDIGKYMYNTAGDIDMNEVVLYTGKIVEKKKSIKNKDKLLNSNGSIPRWVR